MPASLSPPSLSLRRTSSFIPYDKIVAKRTLSKHRHAVPSGPWPWIDLSDEIDPAVQAAIPKSRHVCPHEKNKCEGCWKGYPQSQYPNWTPPQVDRCGISRVNPNPPGGCGIHYIDVNQNGKFSVPINKQFDDGDHELFWKEIQKFERPPDTRIRCLFIENLSHPVLQMLGTKYDVEPFYWSSSINWIPARYQENLQERSDHITISLAFPRAVVDDRYETASKFPEYSEEVIDTQQPLSLKRSLSAEEMARGTNNRDDETERVLDLDILAVHMIRGEKTNTIISHQPAFRGRSITSSETVQTRVYLAGQGIYWGRIFHESKDPTFVLLTMLWYALYAWDQALEYMWEYISYLEVNILNSKEIAFTQNLHRVRAYLLHYGSLLDDFKKSVIFIQKTPNPAMNALSQHEREKSFKLLDKECHNLLVQIERLRESQETWDLRLTNIMQLGFNNVNIEDSRQMKDLTRATVRDSAAMKQIAYLTMFFLPGTFVSAAFGMNITALGSGTETIGHYVIVAVLLTSFTIWIIIALQGTWTNKRGEIITDMKIRLIWPWIVAERVWKRTNFRWKRRPSAQQSLPKHYHDD